MKRLSKKELILLLLGIICIVLFTFSAIKIIDWYYDNKNVSRINASLNKEKIVSEVADNNKTEIIENNDVDKDNPYWSYIKMSLIDVDFSKLKEVNSQIVGWIQVGGTNINYPFVQTSNNDYYLSHSLDKKKNDAGWVFLDYRNNINNLDNNTIIYAHGRLDNTMFGTLKNILKSNWLNNSDNYIIKLSTEAENSLWQIFSAYHIKETSDYLDTSFSSDDSYQAFINLIKNRSIYNFNTDVKTTDKILTLSTCYNSTERMVMHAKLIKKTER